MTNDGFEKASDFEVFEGEATFPPPIQQEVKGGMHIAPEIITRKDSVFIMIDWPNGLPRHDVDHTVRFPHGLMRFGETINECATRIIQNQLGMDVQSVQVVGIDSYVDEADHWHLEPAVLADVAGEPVLHEQASRIVDVQSADDLPTEAVWEKQEFQELVDRFL